MPEGAILHDPQIHPGWHVAGITTDDGNIAAYTGAYAVISMEDGIIYYSPFINNRYFYLPKEGVEEFEICHIPEDALTHLDQEHQHIQEDVLTHLEQHSKKQSLKENIFTGCFIAILFILLIGIYIIPSYREKQWQADIATVNNAMAEKRRKKQQAELEIQQDTYQLAQRQRELQEQVHDVFVLTNATQQVKGKLTPSHPGIGSGVAQLLAKSVYQGNPARDFLDNESKYGYNVSLHFEGNKIAFPHSNYYPDKQKITDLTDKTAQISITVITKMTDEEIDKYIEKSLDVKNRSELERFVPSVRDNHFYRQFRLTEKELQAGELEFNNINLNGTTFQKKNKIYLISAMDSGLSIEEQQQLLSKLTGKFGIKENALNTCCSWQKVSFQ